MSSITDTPVKKHKKHKKDKNREDREGTPSLPGTPGSSRLKLILKVGGSSTPEHSDSPGPPSTSLSVLNVYDEDSQQSNLSMSAVASHAKKSKKKDKKSKKEKKHKHRHKEKRKRERDEINEDLSLPMSMDIDSVESTASTSVANPGSSVRSVTLGEIGFASPSSQSQFELDAFNGAGPGAGGNEGGVFEVEAKPVVPYKLKPSEKQPFQKLLDHLLRALQKKDPHLVFAWPVTDKIAPGYSSIIKNPMDFSTMKSKIDEGAYNTLPEFAEDFKLMCNNATTYNGIETVYYKAAKKILQSGMKILDPERIRSLLPLIPSIRVLSEEALGFCLIPEQISQDNLDSQSEEDNNLENICLDPTKSIHYVPPHPNDPPDLSGAFSDDLTTEEILHQARIAAREAAHRLATKKPNSKMGFLRQRQDGSTSLAILTPTNGVLPGTQEQPVTLNVLAGKIAQGSTQLLGIKDEKKTSQRAVKSLQYGTFSSFAPCFDSTFANLTSTESDMVRATYGDETAVQYAESMIEFAKGCDYAMYMVDELLDTITKGEHKKTVNIIEERKRMEEAEAHIKKQEAEFIHQLESEWDNATSQTQVSTAQDIESLHSLTELGIDTSFVETLKEEENPVITERLRETAQLIEDLQKVQSNRLRLPPHPLPPHVTPQSEEETRLADRITDNLTDLIRNVPPATVAPEEAIRKAIGVDIDSGTFEFSIPDIPEEIPSTQHMQNLELNISSQPTTDESVVVPMEISTCNAPEQGGHVVLFVKEEGTTALALPIGVSNIIPSTISDILDTTSASELMMDTTTTTTIGISSGEQIISSTTTTPPEAMQMDPTAQQQLFM